MISRYKERKYKVFVPEDGLLYVDVPSFSSLRNLLLNQKFRGQAHLRTREGLTPYFGGTIVFHLVPLVLHGVRPCWYGDHDEGVEQLLEDGVFSKPLNAMETYQPSMYEREREWEGPHDMTFELAWIDHVILGVGRQHPTEEQLRELQEVMPDVKFCEREE